MFLWDFQVGRSPAALSLVEPGKLCATIGRPFPATLRAAAHRRTRGIKFKAIIARSHAERDQRGVGKCPRIASGMGWEREPAETEWPQPQEEGEREWKWPDKKQSTIVSDRDSSGSKDINGSFLSKC